MAVRKRRAMSSTASLLWSTLVNDHLRHDHVCNTQCAIRTNVVRWVGECGGLVICGWNVASLPAVLRSEGVLIVTQPGSRMAVV